MTKCIATVGDVFVGTKDNVSIEGIDKCDLYPCIDNVFFFRKSFNRYRRYLQ